jgi:hypothetical protein
MRSWDRYKKIAVIILRVARTKAMARVRDRVDLAERLSPMMQPLLPREIETEVEGLRQGTRSLVTVSVLD